jgi:hypothetical protein
MSRLEEMSKQYREEQISRNDYDKNDEYSGTHPDALSDGDELGKGEKNDSVGSKTDIEQRNLQKARNKYNFNKPYNDSTA